VPTQKANKLPRWPNSEHDEFAELTSESALQQVETGTPFPFDPFSLLLRPSYTVPGLLGSATLSEMLKPLPSAEQQRTERLGKLWEKVRRHPAYKRLHRDPNFKAALKVFRGKQQKKSAGYGGLYSELRFLNIVAASIVSHQERYANVRPKFPSLDIVSTAYGHVVGLLETLDEGIRLSKWPDTDNLRALLIALKQELETERLSGRESKPRADELTPQRWYIDGLIGRLNSTFGDASPKIAFCVAAMMGYEVDPSTIDRRKAAVVKRKKAGVAGG
jgi:hypothetical protein